MVWSSVPSTRFLGRGKLYTEGRKGYTDEVDPTHRDILLTYERKSLFLDPSEWGKGLRVDFCDNPYSDDDHRIGQIRLTVEGRNETLVAYFDPTSEGELEFPTGGFQVLRQSEGEKHHCIYGKVAAKMERLAERTLHGRSLQRLLDKAMESGEIKVSDFTGQMRAYLGIEAEPDIVSKIGGLTVTQTAHG
jgi:hypothetical protein